MAKKRPIDGGTDKPQILKDSTVGDLNAQEYLGAKDDKESLDNLIRDLTQMPWVKPALDAFDRRFTAASEKNTQPTLEWKDYFEVADEIAKKILQKEKRLLDASRSLNALADILHRLARVRDKRTEMFPDDNECPERKAIRSRTKQINRLFRGLSTPQQHVIRYPENICLSLLGEQLKKVSDDYYDRQPINENSRFEKDDDVSATLGNYFTWKRISDYISTIPDETGRYGYLLKIRRRLSDCDPSDEVWSGTKAFSKDQYTSLMVKLDSEIAIYDRIQAHSRRDDQDEKKKEKPSDFTLRRKIMILMALVFDEFQIPIAKHTPERIVGLFRDLVGGDLSDVREFVKAPNRYNGENRNSINRVRKDLEFVVRKLEEAEFADKARVVKSELDYVGDDLIDAAASGDKQKKKE